MMCIRPIEVKLKCRVFNFVLECPNSDVGLVRSVTRHVISLMGCQSAVDNNFVSCSQLFSLHAIVPDECYNLGHNQTIVMACDWTRFINVPVSTMIPSISYLNSL